MPINILLPHIINIGVYDSDIYSKLRHGSATPDRITDRFEIELPTDEGGTSHIDGNKYQIRPDRIIVAKPDQLRHTVLPYKCRYIQMNAHGELSERLKRLPTQIQLSEAKKTGQLFRDLIYIFANQMPDGELLLQSRVLELIWMLENDSRQKHRDVILNDSIAGALRYIDDNIGRNITLDELAGSQHISPVYFHKIFKKTLGTTPYRYILDKKLAIAKNHLILTNKSCLDIAVGLGFSSQSYFNYAFRKETGLSPLQFRKDWYSRYPE